MPAKRKRRARGEGSIFQRSDGLWVGQRREKGKRAIIVYAHTRIEAAEKLFKERIKTSPVDAAGDKMTIAQWLDHWVETVKQSLERGTWRKYESHSNVHIKPLIGDVVASKMTTADAQKFLGELQKAGRNPATVRKVATTLSVALGALAREGGIPVNPMTGIRKPRGPQTTAHPLDTEGVARFLEAARSDRLYLFYLLLIDTGARPGELYALKWTDINEAEGFISITKTMEDISTPRDKPTKTQKSRRRVDLTTASIAEIPKHRARMEAEFGQQKEHVFLTPSGTRLRGRHVTEFSFIPLVKRASVSLKRLYDLRHTSATLLLLAGEDTKVVSERLGHSTTMLTQNTYQHVLPQMQKRAAQKIGKIIDASLGRESNHAIHRDGDIELPPTEPGDLDGARSQPQNE